ncbi:MAG: adenylate/guanylate cyclase domain-containing protein [Pseudomonadota bacterium]
MSTLRSVRNFATDPGKNAANNVFDGQIERGAGQTIRAALWSSDLQGFTTISDEVPRDQLLEMVNAYFECIVQSVHKYGGNVLKFMGDGVLAIFDKGSDELSTCAALHVAEHLRRQISELTSDRRNKGLPATGLYLGLHLGEVYCGNVGSPSRVDFTVTGPAVNEVSRIEGMCRTMNKDIVISQDFADKLGIESVKLTSLGTHNLGGVSRDNELFTMESFGTLLC